MATKSRPAWHHRMAEAGFGMLTCHGAEMCEHLRVPWRGGRTVGGRTPALAAGGGAPSSWEPALAVSPWLCTHRSFRSYTFVSGEARLMCRRDLGRKAYSM